MSRGRIEKILFPSLEHLEELGHSQPKEAVAGYGFGFEKVQCAKPLRKLASWGEPEPQSDAWLDDLRRLSVGEGMHVHLHVPSEHPNVIAELRQQCNELQGTNNELRARLDALEKTVGRMRDLAEKNASDRFATLCDRWKRETRLVSNITKKSIHPAYQQIIAMGYAAVPLILRDLQENGPQDWFWALTTITEENPITEEIAGKMGAMTEAWLTWGVKKGFLNDSTQKTKQRSPDSSALAIE
jgi:uncharacterized protein YukE